MRVLGACLQSALRHGYAARNPVRDLPLAERPRPERTEAAYFENAELPRLFVELPDGLIKTLFLLALKTGMRQGELIALCWREVDLSERVIRVKHTYAGEAVSTPKNHERRESVGPRGIAILIPHGDGFRQRSLRASLRHDHLLREHTLQLEHRLGEPERAQTRC